jgi:RNA polymerase sigma factor (sigma-70 family)
MSEEMATVDVLVASCAGILVSLARRYWRAESGITLDEMMHEARVSVWRSAVRWQTFEERTGKFSSYAFNRIRHDLYQFCCDMSQTIRVPRQATHERRREMLVPTVSLDEVLRDGDSTRYDFIQATEEPGVYSEDEVEWVRHVMATLPERERWVLRERFLNERTHQSLATELGITREGVRQRELVALRKIRKRLEAQRSLAATGMGVAA